MKLFFQLYSARNTSLDEALATVAKSGYAGVETYRDNFLDPAALRAGLEKYALSMPSMHINLNALRADFSACVAQARAFDCTHVVCPYLEAHERPEDAHGWQVLGAELADIEAKWSQEGCSFAWHNHDFEFIALADGSMPIEHLLETAQSMKWEIDVAWIVRAAADPSVWIERYKAKLSAIHLKDIAPQGECIDEDGWADLGHGVVSWNKLMPQLMESSAQLYIVEHDNPASIDRFAKRSFDTAQLLVQ